MRAANGEGRAAARLGIAALGMLSVATLCQPDDADGYVALGIAHARRREVMSAIAALERAVSLEPGNFLARLELGELYRQSSMERRSRAHLAAALSAARTAEERAVARLALHG
jgi:cytochrome c-type biogenesis protein CcmH/NrfG